MPADASASPAEVPCRPAAAAEMASGAAGSASTTASRMGRRHQKRAVERSCIVCHRRKVRCDKSMPCANCMRAGILCCYPSSERGPRQPKTTIADIASRLVQLERTLVAVSAGEHASSVLASPGRPAAERERERARTATAAAAAAAAAPPSGPTPAAAADVEPRTGASTPRSTDDDAASTAAEDMLLQDSYASRYINEILLSRVLEEEQEIQTVLGQAKDQDTDHTPDSDSPTSGVTATAAAAGSSTSVMPPLKLFGTLTGTGTGYGLQHADRTRFRPPRRHAIQLWQAFKQNVEPLNKLLHVPSVEIEVFTAINQPETVTPAFDSLLFSMYFSTATSYQPDEYEAAFGEDKAVAMHHFRAAMEQSLAEANFLEAPNLTTLQALALFLRSSRASSPGRSNWILDGMIIRAAQSIGMHRDGSNFGLSPFESEMRRRVWWHIITQDARAAEDHGIAVSTLDPSSDIRFPLNVNDTDLDPDMAELPPQQTRWTEMTLAACMIRLSYTMQLLSQMVATPSPPPTEARRLEVLADHTAFVEQLIQKCNAVVPIQRLTKLMVRLVKLKFEFVSRLQLVTVTTANPSGSGRAPHATEENLLGACAILELNLDIMTDELLQSYRWSAEIYPQYHIILYLLWHLCVKPVGSSVDRAWKALDGVFEVEISRQRRQNIHGMNPKWEVLAALRDKAWGLRTSIEKAAAAAGGVHAGQGADRPPGDSSAAAATAPATAPTVTPAVAPAVADTTNSFVPVPQPAPQPVPAASDLMDTDTLPFFENGIGGPWDESFMDWDAFADDFRTKDYDFRPN